MQLVAESYYVWYNRVATALSGILAIAVVASWLLAPLKQYGEPFGFTVVALVLALVHVFYGVLLFRREARINPWAAGLYSSMILTLNLINLIHNTGQLHSWYLVGWGLMVFFSGIFGLYGVVGYSFLVTIYYVIIETGPSTAGQLSLTAIGGVFATYLAGLLGYMFWRTKFVDSESRKVQQLTGQLKTKQQQAELLIQSIADGMIVVTTEGVVSLMNPAAAKLTEWEVGEASGIDIHLVVKLQTEDGKDVDPNENPFTTVFKKKSAIDQTLVLIGRNGATKTVSLVVSPVMTGNENVSGAIAIIRDVSEARAEEKRRADFISTASHEMRTPVAAIEGYLALAMNEKVSSIDQKARSYLEKAHASTQHLGKLFQDLLTSAKAEDGRLVSHPTAVEMGSFLEQLTDSLRFAAEKKGLLLDFVIGSSAGAGERVVKPLYYVHVDPDRLSEVITNLFDNAVKYTESGKISVGLTGDTSVVQFYIHDTGPGIPANDVPHLFQKFYRVDSSSTRTIGGTGLGLFICRKIVELYKGRIWVESEEGKGSTFYINMPRLTSQKANELIALNQAQQPSIGGPTKV